MKFFLIFIQALLGVYLAGELARQNGKVNAFISQIENNYETWNERIRHLDIKKAVIFLKKIYAIISITITIAFFLTYHYFPEYKEMNDHFSMVAVFFIFLWVTLQWYTEDKKISDFKYQFFIFIASPLIMGFCDFFTGSNFIQEMAKIYSTMANGLGFNPPLTGGPIYLGLMMAVFGFILIAVQYIYTAIISYPVAMLSIAIVAFPIYFARIVHGFNPKKSFAGFAVITLFIVTVVLGFFRVTALLECY